MVDVVCCNGSILRYACVCHHNIDRGVLLTIMLNSTELEICHAHNGKMSTIVGILSFVSMINTTSENLKAGKSLNLSAFES